MAQSYHYTVKTTADKYEPPHHYTANLGYFKNGPTVSDYNICSSVFVKLVKIHLKEAEFHYIYLRKLKIWILLIRIL